MTSPLNTKQAEAQSSRIWEDEILPTLSDYIRIPNVSQGFDPRWREHGHMDRAAALIETWCKRQPVKGLGVEIVRLEGRAPLIVMEIPGSGTETVLLYGHLDKQPGLMGWREGLSAWEPVREGDKLYGRGGADDGYAAFASLTAIRLVQEQGLAHARCIVLIESGEESGSPDLPAYIDALAARIGTPSLIVCLDSGCGNYDQLWMTTSLRGLIAGDLRVEILTEGVHSGTATGIVPSTFRLVRQLLSRIEDEQTGKILLGPLHVAIPPARVSQAALAAEALHAEVYDQFPWVKGAGPIASDLGELVLNRTWRPALAVTGAEGLPPLDSAGNVLRPATSVKLSLRIPPRLDATLAAELLKATLEREPPYGAHVTFSAEKAGSGWDAPPLAPWLEQALDEASNAYFGKPPLSMGEGGSIPFMGMLGEKFPKAQFLITGVLGPHSNAHGTNEFLHIPMAKKLTACVASVIAAHHGRNEQVL